MSLGPQFSQPELDGMPKKSLTSGIGRHRLDKYAPTPGITPELEKRVKTTENFFASPTKPAQYDSAVSMAGDWQPNPIRMSDEEEMRYSKWATAEYLSGKRVDWGNTESEFVPTHRVNSTQPEVNLNAIKHQVKNANPLALDDDPEVVEYPGEDGKPMYQVGDGNHRTNAALLRGQLFMPAKVVRYKRDMAAPFPKPAPASNAPFNASDYF